MEHIIVYGSRYGSTRRYAEKLSEQTDIPAISYKDAPALSDRKTIVYLGGLYAGGVLGIAKTLRSFSLQNGQKLLLVTVGLADPNEPENQDNIRASLQRQLSPELLGRAKIFHLRGGIDYQKLSFGHRTMMKLLYQSLRRTPPGKTNGGKSGAHRNLWETSGFHRFQCAGADYLGNTERNDMNSAIKNILKILLIGLATTFVRIIGQLSIPAGEQTVLAPSVFAQNGTMPLAFTIYGIFAYSLIAALFLLVRKQMGGNRVWQGLQYGFACCVVWIVYLLEPLPHVAPLDRIAYPIADSLALIVMGLLLGGLFGNPAQRADKKKLHFPILPVLAVTACFFAGRMIQYLIFGIYSSFDEKQLETVLWCLFTGAAISCVAAWLNLHIRNGNRVKRAMVVGCLLFGVDLILFNFFMPLVFDADIPDLIFRTFIDILTVTLGCLAFSNKRNAVEL